MSSNEERISDAIVSLEQDAEVMREFTQGAEDETVETEGGVVPTLQKLVKEVREEVTAVTTEAVSAASSAMLSAAESASKAEQAELAVDQVVASTGNANDASQAADLSAQIAADAAATAAAAADAAQLSAGVYPSTAAGIASTLDGKYFSVPSSSVDEYLILYKNEAGLAVEQKRYMSSGAINAAIFASTNKVDQRIDRNENLGMYRDGVKNFAFPIMDKMGKTVGFLGDGGVFATHLEVPSLAEMSLRDGPLGIPIIQSMVDGRNGISFDPNTGKTFLLLSDAAIAFVASRMGQVSSYLPLSAVRGSYSVSSVRESADHTVAAVQDRGGQNYDAKQLADGNHDTLVIDRIGPIDFDPSYGQSNAGQGGTAGVVESRKLWPHTVVSFDGRFQMQGNNGLVVGTDLTDLVPAYDPTGTTVGQYPATMRANAWAQLQCDNGLPQQGSIVASAWQGSTAASGFIPGTNNWLNLMTFADRAVACAALYGRTVACRFLTYIQGENSANWAADFATMATAVIPAIKAKFNQTSVCEIALWQIVGVAPDNGVGTQQILASNTRSDTKLVGTMSAFPIFDTLHLTAEGRLMQGDVHAEFRLQIALGKTWTPLIMSTAVRTGATVVITVNLPPGTRAVSKDVDWVPQVAQDGFVYIDDSGVTPITGIAYEGNKITLTLASVPSGGSPRVRYAMDVGPGVGWYAMAGNAIALTESLSPSHRLGHATPKYIRHNLIRQQLGVTT